MSAGRSDRASVRRRARRSSWSSLVAVLVTVIVSAVPGSASAAPPSDGPRVLPLVDCYAENSDGSLTVILGYRSSHPATRTIPAGTRNYARPSTYTSQLPTVFEPGEHNGVATLTVSADDRTSNDASWSLDGTTLNYHAASRNVGACSSAQLPALAHGGVLVVLLLGAGAIGVLVVRRARQRVTDGA